MTSAGAEPPGPPGDWSGYGLWSDVTGPSSARAPSAGSTSGYGIMPDVSPGGSAGGPRPPAGGPLAVAGGPPSGAAGGPPELWERVSAAYKRWLGRHEALARVLYRLSRISQRAALIALVVALVVVPRLGIALVPMVFMLGCLAVLTVAARTRTVTWRSVTLMMSASVPWALVVALVTQAVGSACGLTPLDDGMKIALAAFVEEPGKLMPLLVVALVAPGRVRRFALADWALLGLAAGAGYTIAEDGVRRLNAPGLLQSILGENRVGYSLNPWTAGSLSTSGSGLTDLLTGKHSSAIMTVGHQVSTMTLAMGIGLSITLWRMHRPLRATGRLLSWVPAAGALAMAVADHAGYNATVSSSSSWVDSGEGIPAWLRFMWLTGGRGHLQVRVSVGLFLVCLLVDAYRRLGAGPSGRTVFEAPRVPMPGLVGAPPPVRAVVQAVVAVVAFTWSDAAVVLGAYADPAMDRAARMANGRAMGVQVRGVRADAMAATTPGSEPEARWRFRLVALVVGVAGAAACGWYGTLVARGIGHSVIADGDGVFFAGLLDGLAAWWESLGPAGQILMTAVGVLVLTASGLSLALALGAVGAGTWAFSHGHGLASFLRSPRAAARGYVTTVTPGQLALDLVDFALTFIPGSALGLGARTTAESLAASRAMREGIEAQEQAVRRAGDAFHNELVLESRDAYQRAVQRHTTISRVKRDRQRAVSSDGVHTLSGWGLDRRPGGFQDPNVDEVLRVTDDMDYPRTVKDDWDHGEPGRYYASHAERQEALTAERPAIGVSKKLCEDCPGWFRHFAQYRGRTWYVTDPDGTWAFYTDGSVTMPSGRQIAFGEPFPGKYLNH